MFLRNALRQHALIVQTLRRSGDERSGGELIRVRECVSQVRVERLIALDEDDAVKCTLCGL